MTSKNMSLLLGRANAFIDNWSSQLGLEVTCQGNGCRLTYTWDIYRQIGSDLNGNPVWQRKSYVQSILMSKLSSPGFVVRPNQLEGSTTYRCTVSVNTPGLATSYSEYTFTTNAPPTGGQCSISPLSGEALVTSFRLSCSAWSDTETPLKYQNLQHTFGIKIALRTSIATMSRHPGPCRIHSKLTVNLVIWVVFVRRLLRQSSTKWLPSK
jgi:hypothetical protein